MLKIGADPELFCFDNKTKSFISAHSFFPGTKEKPFAVDHGALQLDGLAAEINIEPATTADGFADVLQSVINTASKFLPEGVTLVPQPSVVFDQEYFDSIPEDFKRLGCTPDYNAWMFGSQNESPFIDIPSLRAAGGHLHMGWTENKTLQDEEHAAKSMALVKQLDCSVGLMCLLWDLDDKRRTLYGRAGAMRPKSYGVEYRTPSNYWLTSREKMKSVFEVAEKAYNDLEKGLVYFEVLPFNVPQIINTGNRQEAKEAFDAVRKIG